MDPPAVARRVVDADRPALAVRGLDREDVPVIGRAAILADDLRGGWRDKRRDPGQGER
ncbi:MAG TPA: hypothetical protein VFR75_09695 [Solirubrobacterales bacterium]|nr:hypothetical protein [Solirubrobacterales bacterium]